MEFTGAVIYHPPVPLSLVRGPECSCCHFPLLRSDAVISFGSLVRSAVCFVPFGKFRVFQLDPGKNWLMTHPVSQTESSMCPRSLHPYELQQPGTPATHDVILSW